MSPNRGLPQAASYTDDTSLPHAALHVSIHAQIIREHKISWYFFLKDKTPHRGEFKTMALNTFLALSEIDRENVFKTLRTVRIHIVDPRPYTVDLHDAIKKHLPKGSNLTQFLKRLDDSTAHLAFVRQSALQSIATRILMDAPAERLKQEYRAWEHASGSRLALCGSDLEEVIDMGVRQGPQEPEAFDLAPFEHAKANVLKDVANFVSASASVFSEALDEFQEAREDYFFRSPMAGPYLINSTLTRPHAFDEGHSDRIRWIEQQRTDVLSRTDVHKHFYPRNMPDPLQEIPSADSHPIQAADIAATIARELWYRNGLTHLVKRFEYVTFNGERLSDGRANQYESLFRTIQSSN